VTVSVELRRCTGCAREYSRPIQPDRTEHNLPCTVCGAHVETLPLEIAGGPADPQIRAMRATVNSILSDLAITMQNVRALSRQLNGDEQPVGVMLEIHEPALRDLVERIGTSPLLEGWLDGVEASPFVEAQEPS
jgi:PP-loop superfamily ATP-utilizing enzyme